MCFYDVCSLNLTEPHTNEAIRCLIRKSNQITPACLHMDAKAQIVSLGHNWDTEMLTKPRLRVLHVRVPIEDIIVQFWMWSNHKAKDAYIMKFNDYFDHLPLPLALSLCTIPFLSKFRKRFDLCNCFLNCKKGHK